MSFAEASRRSDLSAEDKCQYNGSVVVAVDEDIVSGRALGAEEMRNE